MCSSKPEKENNSQSLRKDIKDTHRVKAPPSAYKNYEYGHFGHWYIKSTLYKRFKNKLKQKFQNNKVVTGKTPFFVSSFCTHHSICLNVSF